MTPFSLNRPWQRLLLVAVFITATMNIHFFTSSMALYPPSEYPVFYGSLLLFSFAVQLFTVALLALLLPLSAALILALLVGATSSYFSDTYGTVIDTEMLRNVLESNTAESLDLLSPALLLRLALLSALPILLLLSYPAKNSSTWTSRRDALFCGIGALLLLLGIILSQSDQYASFLREHKQVRYYLNPGYPVYSALRFGGSLISSSEPHIFNQLNAGAALPEGDDDRELVIMVVGETARADHFALNGYSRDTTPLLSQQRRLISYRNIESCGTSTAISVPCMFSYLTHDDMNVDEARASENILDVLSQAGVTVLWRDNNSDSKGVAARLPFEDFRKPDNNPACDTECRDIGLLGGLQDYIDSHDGDLLIVLHQMGSHGPAYAKRYPSAFEHFTPACQSPELSTCSQQAIINAYDNSIRYTDYFLNAVISLLQKNTPRFETAMFYVSDHGESLGENHLYLHGMPYALAPEAQTHVPVLVWAGESSDIDLRQSQALSAATNSHDVVFDTLLKLFEVESQLKPKADAPLLILQDSH